MPLEYTGNLIECGFWCLIALVLLASSFRAALPLRLTVRILGLTFLLFGFSDYIEAHTGAWWTPWWLLLLKVGCILVFVWGGIRYRRISQRLPE